MGGTVNERRGSRRRAAEPWPWRSARLRPGRDVVLLDVGDGGALVEASARMLPGTPVVLQLLMPEGARCIRGRVLRCEVASLDPCRGVRYRGALRFDEPQSLIGEGATRDG